MTLIDHNATTTKLGLAQEAKQSIEHEHRAMASYVTTVEGERIRVANELHAEASRRTHFEHELEYLRTHDALTTLPNRPQFMTLLETAFEAVRDRTAKHGRFAVYVVDIDHCKQINDSLGSKVGDSLLVQCGERLLDVVGVDDVVARLDSDSFAMITFGTSTVRAATSIARKIRAAFAVPWHLAQVECLVTASVGVVVVDDCYTCADDIFRDANIALNHSKQQGRDRCSFFKESFGTIFQSKVELDRTLALALANREFGLVYQPIVSLLGVTRHVEGFEALLRWQRRDGVQVSPAAFIPAAEESGLIVPLGAWALKTACLQLRQWRRLSAVSLQISVNVSAIQLGDSRFSSTVLDVIREADIDPRELIIEVTESAAMLDPERSLRVLRELRGLGIGVHIDDFGTGYSSLSYLRRLPVTRVKIDRSFVSADDRDDLVDPVIVAAIISLAHQLDVKVIAEGVETLTQLRTLRDLGCDSVQGYFVSRPVPASEATAFTRGGDCLEAA
jgi:diguanylate cyclase (GGDEF)-like protein